MDKNTITGFLLMFAILVGFYFINKPSEEQLERIRQYNDSIALVQQKAYEEQRKQDSLAKLQVANDTTFAIANDSVRQAIQKDVFGAYSASAFGEEEFITVENEVLKLVFSTKGGRIYSAELKNYRTHDSLPLMLFDGKESSFDFTLLSNNNRVVKSSELNFKQEGNVVKDAEGNQILTLRMQTTLTDSYMDFVYTIPADQYMIGYEIRSHKMDEVMTASTNLLELKWKSLLRQQERGESFENRYSSLYYKFTADSDVESLSDTKAETQELANKVKWISFKDQFFNSTLIADDSFTSTVVKTTPMKEEGTGYLKELEADMVVGYDPTGAVPTGFRFFLGPNHAKTLRQYDKNVSSDDKLHLRSLIPMGGKLISWINTILIIPVFNFLSKFISNYGIIILLLTLFIKLLIFPLTYKSYMSSAKMKALQPEIQKINEKIPAEKAMERQQATMALYKKVGVSPMSGCVPMLLQFPILIAMYNFFPGSIELRQESFLWAKDLSTYDAIISWSADIPIISGLFDYHISLFCVLMTITQIISTKLMSNNQMSSDQPGASMMKYMMYLMPLMFFFMFNNYSAALSYYFFLSSLITVIQTYAIRATIDEDKLRAQLQAKGKANEGKPKKTGGFMARLEKMQKEQEKMMRERNKRK